ncbi:MAG TPA: glycosyltransferase family 1 protein [Gaiellaceae bacterium]|nr:glycosyltransferase family 1 protein [Gaiellaceae bacterium]
MSVLGVDGHRLTGSRSGVGRYVAELLREWVRMEPRFEEIVVFVPPDVDAAALPPRHPYRVETMSGTGGVAFHFGLARAARGVDLLFCPSYAAPLSYRGPFVVTVHDALSAVMPPQPGLRQRLRHRATARSAKRARRVITVSETSRVDIAREYGVSLSKVTSVPNGVGAEFFVPPTPAQAEEVRARYALEGIPFCLFVGKFARRRNLPVLAEAFVEARSRADVPDVLLLVGENSTGERLPESAHVRTPGYVPEHDLHVLYHEAQAFVYPSSYEGFGLPVLEAMAAGTPVLTARNSALVEVAGEAALLVDEPNRDQLAAALVTLLTDAALRERLSELGRQRARLFPWSRTAAETMDVLSAVSSAAA